MSTVCQMPACWKTKKRAASNTSVKDNLFSPVCPLLDYRFESLIIINLFIFEDMILRLCYVDSNSHKPTEGAASYAIRLCINTSMMRKETHFDWALVTCTWPLPNEHSHRRCNNIYSVKCLHCLVIARSHNYIIIAPLQWDCP